MTAVYDFELMEYIKAHQGEKMTGQILANHFYTSKGNMCRRLQLLEKQGKIKRIKTIIFDMED